MAHMWSMFVEGHIIMCECGAHRSYVELMAHMWSMFVECHIIMCECGAHRTHIAHIWSSHMTLDISTYVECMTLDISTYELHVDMSSVICELAHMWICRLICGAYI